MKRVLDVGQCAPDHMAIRRLLESMGAEVEQAALPNEAIEKLSAKDYALVLVNRKIDRDYSDGTELVRSMQANERLRSTPVMLISNYPEAQDEAVRLGAQPGFGKLALNDPQTRARLEVFLGPVAAGD